jgi:hypothetical protein
LSHNQGTAINHSFHFAAPTSELDENQERTDLPNDFNICFYNARFASEKKKFSGCITAIDYHNSLFWLRSSFGLSSFTWNEFLALPLSFGKFYSKN